MRHRSPGIFVNGLPVNLSNPEGNMGKAQQKDFMESGSAGREQTLPAAQVAGVGVWVSLVKLTTDEDKRSVPVTVTFGASGPVASPLSPQGRGSIRARLTWGSGGTIETTEIDFVNGLVVTLVCSSVIVEMRNDTTLTNVIARAFVAKGSKGGTGVSPTFTVPANAELPTIVGTNVSIPAFAKRVQIYKNNPSDDLSVRILNSAIQEVGGGAPGVDFLSVRIDSGPLTQFPLIEIPGGAQWMQVVNNNVSPNTASVLLVYTLLL
jgi:hypothetical protein